MTRADEWRLVRAATPGPWEACHDDTGGPFTYWPSISAVGQDASIIHRAGFKQEYWGDWSLREAKANAAFIAHFNPARVAELLAERDMLRGVGCMEAKEDEAYRATMPEMTRHQEIASLRQSRDRWHAAHAEDVSMLQREVARLREVLAGIATPLHIDGENHMAAVLHAREVLNAQAGEGNT